MVHDVAQSKTAVDTFFNRSTAEYMRWYGVPISLETEVETATSEATLEATVDTCFSKRSAFSHSAQDVSLQ